MTGTKAMLIAACVAVAGIAACGDDTTELPTAGSGTVAGPTTDAAPTTGASPATTAPPTSTAPTTTTTMAATTTVAATTTTAPPTTVPEPSPAGWTEVDPDTVSVKAFPPCCADNWHGDVSPPLAPVGEELADGPYAVATQWPADATKPLELEVFRFEQCVLLPESGCEQPGIGYDFGPDELGVDTSASRPLTVPLDQDVGVVVVGWDTAPDNGSFVVEEATGAELAGLAVEVDQAYAEVFAAPFAAGEDPEVIVTDVLENPTGGFGPGRSSYNAVAFSPEAGPALLFQAPFPYVDGQPTAGRGTDVLTISSIEIVDGRTTLFVYAGYYP